MPNDEPMIINGVSYDPVNTGNEWTTVSRKSRKKVPNSIVPSSSVLNTRNSLRISRKLRKREKREAKTHLKRIIEEEHSRIHDELHPEIVDEYIPSLSKALVEFFRTGYNKYYREEFGSSDEDILRFINNTIIKYKLKISGGFILKGLGLINSSEASSSKDIDIYLPSNSAREVYSVMSKLFNSDKYGNGKRAGMDKFKLFRVAPHGAKGKFFRMNGIDNVRKYERSDPYAEMDLVCPIPSRSPIGVIKAFDLTFCQNWYDGEHLYMMHKKAVLKEEPGYLMPSYIELYLTEKNPSTIGRIAKYMKRGFRIAYIDPETETIIEITEPPTL